MRFALTLVSVAAIAARSAWAKAVFAHFMVANTDSFNEAQWRTEISAAKAIGIQGFVLNTAGNSYEPNQISTAYSVAESLGGFSFFYSFDFAHPWSVSEMASYISAHAGSTATYKWNNAVLVSSFSGQDNGNSFWASLKSTLSSEAITISLAPAFISYRDPGQAQTLLNNFPSIDGFTNWWSWPADNGNLLTTQTDLAYQSAVKSSRTGPFIMAVSPWQFKNLGSSGGDTGNDWVELSDTLIKYRWEQAINDVKPDIVEIVTWNDYAESHYIGALNSNVYMDADAHAYVDGADHTPWQIIMKYYISWYLNGAAPAVTKDQVVVWYRLHPKGAVCNTGTLPRNSQYPADAVFGFALLTSAATVTMDIGSNNHAEWNAPAGVSIGSVPFPTDDNQIPYIQIERNGAVVQSGYGAATWSKSCQTYNFNPFVGVIPN
ncbi:glycoside hydrolase family 71 protein [Peniophora sp. CONT]|nr:glycoside hydrolase family 71 protein [Peniophora sp. CONT]